MSTFARHPFHGSRPGMGLTLTLIVVSMFSTGHSESIIIGGLFEMQSFDQSINPTSNQFQESAARLAINKINQDGNFSITLNVSLEVQSLIAGDTFNTSNEVCNLLGEGIIAMIGSQTPPSTTFVRSVSKVFGLPHIHIGPDYVTPPDDYSINLYPDHEYLSRAYADLLNWLGWEKFIVLYETKESRFRLQGIADLIDKEFTHGVLIKLPNSTAKYGSLMEYIRRNHSDINSIVIDCDADKLSEIFKEAKRNDLTTNHHRYILTSLDVHTLNLTMSEDGMMGKARAFFYRLINPDSSEMKILKESQGVNFSASESGILRTDAALAYDGIEFLSRGFGYLLENSSDPSSLEVTPQNCNIPEVSEHGLQLSQTLKTLTMNGLSGLIQLNPEGRRTNFSLTLMYYYHRSVKVRVLNWRDYNPIDRFPKTNWVGPNNLTGYTFVVSAKLSKPFLYRELNGELVGHTKDLLANMSGILGCNFTFHDRYLRNDSHGTTDDSVLGWNGCMGDLLSGNAHLVVGDLTATYERSQAIDFSKSIMSVGISILSQKAESHGPGILAFMDPFHWEVWAAMGIAYLGVSLALFLLEKIKSRRKPHLRLSLGTSLWHSMASFLQRGSDDAARSTSTRMVVGVWWLFVWVMVSSYTANLTAFLTQGGMDEGIQSVKDLVKQSKIKYGTIGSGSTADFFKNSQVPLYKEIWENMKNMKDPFVKGVEDGAKKVASSQGKFVLFMESASIEYYTERDCSLTKLGENLDVKSFAFGFRKGSWLKKYFDMAIVELATNGKLQELKEKWWKREGGGKCEKTALNDGVGPLTIEHLMGIFILFGGGCLISSVAAVLEYCINGRKNIKSTEKSDVSIQGNLETPELATSKDHVTSGEETVQNETVN